MPADSFSVYRTPRDINDDGFNVQVLPPLLLVIFAATGSCRFARHRRIVVELTRLTGSENLTTQLLSRRTVLPGSILVTSGEVPSTTKSRHALLAMVLPAESCELTRHCHLP